MTFKDCLSYLERVEVYGIKFGLDNIRAVLNDLGNPEKRFPSILVAGTNGKGSVCAMLAEVFLRHGLRVGLYTSPHLVSVEERVRLDRRPIPPRDFCRLLEKVKDSCDRLLEAGKLSAPLTYFEHLTTLAFLFFREKKVDLAILEVGMGGRLDATNVVVPLVSVITSIGLDHQKYLGPTLGRIAFEKAGIIKPGVPVVCALDPGVAYRTIKKRARELGAPFVGVFDQPAGLRVTKGTNGYRFIYRREGRTYRFGLRLAGKHQGRNAAAAITVASVLNRTWPKVEPGTLMAGIRQAAWLGRLEVFGRKPLVMLDGAHNEEGASALAAYVQDFMPRPTILVFAVMRDKDIRPIVRELFPCARRIILTTIPMHRAAWPEEVLAQAGPFRKKIVLEPDLKRALAAAKALALKAKGSVLVAGSLFLVGECKKLGRR